MASSAAAHHQNVARENGPGRPSIPARVSPHDSHRLAAVATDAPHSGQTSGESGWDDGERCALNVRTLEERRAAKGVTPPRREGPASACAALGGFDGVAEQHRDRGRADTSDPGGDRTGDRLAPLVDVGEQLPALV